MNILNKKRFVVVIVIVLVMLIIGGSYYFYKQSETQENKTSNALISISSYGIAQQSINLYKKPDLNSKVMCQIGIDEEFSIVNDKDYTDSLGNIFTKVIYRGTDNIARIGYVEKNKIRIINPDDVDDDIVEPAPNSFSVYFDSDGGTAIESQIINVGDVVIKPQDPKKTGYTFSGWTLNGVGYDFNSVVTSNMTLKASWKPIQYTVKFDTDRGSKIGDKIVNYGELVKKPDDPIKAGNKFKNWTLNGKKYSFDTKVTQDMTLRATYTYDFTKLNKCNSTENRVLDEQQYSLYRCVADYGLDYTAYGKNSDYNSRMGQGFAVTSNYVYINYPVWGAWSSDEKALAIISKNFVHRIDRKNSKRTTTTINYGGHGQSFDVASDVLYYNAYPYMKWSEDFKAYGANYRGFAYGTFKKSDIMVPTRAIILSNDGKYLTSYDGNSYNISNINKRLKQSEIVNPEIAVDEPNNTVAFVSGKRVFIHNLTKMKNKDKSSLLRTININYDKKQGIELYGNSLYLWQDNGKYGKFKLSVFNVSKGNAGKTINSSKDVNIDLSSYYVKSNGKDGANCEAEGMSISGGKIYLSVMCREEYPGYSKGDFYQLVWK